MCVCVCRAVSEEPWLDTEQSLTTGGRPHRLFGLTPSQTDPETSWELRLTGFLNTALNTSQAFPGFPCIHVHFCMFAYTNNSDVKYYHSRSYSRSCDPGI